MYTVSNTVDPTRALACMPSSASSIVSLATLPAIVILWTAICACGSLSAAPRGFALGATGSAMERCGHVERETSSRVTCHSIRARDAQVMIFQFDDDRNVERYRDGLIDEVGSLFCREAGADSRAPAVVVLFADGHWRHWDCTLREWSWHDRQTREPAVGNRPLGPLVIELLVRMLDAFLWLKRTH